MGGTANPDTGFASTTDTGSAPTTGAEGTTTLPDMTTGEPSTGDEVDEYECDVWTQDCPEGQKCMPWANDGNTTWNATKCSPVDPNPGQPGDSCISEDFGYSGVDDCDERWSGSTRNWNPVRVCLNPEYDNGSSKSKANTSDFRDDNYPETQRTSVGQRSRNCDPPAKNIKRPVNDYSSLSFSISLPSTSMLL